jgi:hypothetical protein
MGRRAIAWGVILVASGCGGSDGSNLFSPDDGGEAAAPADASADTTVDAGDDATIEDSATDGGPDGRHGDATTDSGADAHPDGGSDAGGACSADNQCSPPATICDTTAGKCVANICAVPNTTCPRNPADECCTLGAAVLCVPGNCCTNAQCSGATPACVDATCRACDAVGPPYHFHVDPVNGSDAASSTGSSTAGGVANVACALKTITRALQLVPASPPPGTEIIVDVTSTVEAGETFPITVPSNVTIRAAATAAVTVRVPGGETGFALPNTGSALADLTLDGQAGAAQYGMTSAGTSTLTGVDVHGFELAGVLVDGGTLTITGGSILQRNGTNSSPAPGLSVIRTAAVTITGGTNHSPTAFNENQGAGIAVEGGGSISLTGVPGALAGSGTVVANRNGASGVTIGQTAATPPVNAIDGLVAFSNGASGIGVLGGSALRLRNSVLVNASEHGVHVTSGSGTAGDDLSRIDLGDPAAAAEYGRNVLQDPAVPNGGVGVCLALGGILPLGHTLKAAGNNFGPGLNCATTNATLMKNACNAGSKGTVGITGLLDSIDATMCKVN